MFEKSVYFFLNLTAFYIEMDILYHIHIVYNIANVKRFIRRWCRTRVRLKNRIRIHLNKNPRIRILSSCPDPDPQLLCICCCCLWSGLCHFLEKQSVRRNKPQGMFFLMFGVADPDLVIRFDPVFQRDGSVSGFFEQPNTRFL